jgi:hypothetical protein
MNATKSSCVGRLVEFLLADSFHDRMSDGVAQTDDFPLLAGVNNCQMEKVCAGIDPGCYNSIF